MRHNDLRDAEARLLKQVCRDVKVEPGLLPTDQDFSGNVADEARSDISVRGLWSSYHKTFMDVRVSHPTSNSNMRKTLEQLCREHEQEKKVEYNNRILHTQRATFTPLVFLTTGGMAIECERMNKKVAELIALKTGESYSHVMSHLRSALRFALLRAMLVAIRGTRGSPWNKRNEYDLADISYNLIPRTKIT